MDDLKIAKRYINKAKNAALGGEVFDLSFRCFKNIMIAKKCAYTGIKLTEKDDVKCKSTDRTVDRVDSSKGYVVGNVVACCHLANQLKSMCENDSNVWEFKHLEAMIKTMKKRGMN